MPWRSHLCLVLKQENNDSTDNIDFDADGGSRECIYCDQLIQSAEKWKRHVENCRTLALQQQEQIEKKGYNQVFHQLEHKDMAVEPRTTRARARTPVKEFHSLPLTRKPLHEKTVGDSSLPGRSKKGNIHAPEDGYISGPDTEADAENISSSDNTTGSASEDSSAEENVTLSALVKSGTQALIIGPWNKPLQQSKLGNQTTDCTRLPDWTSSAHSPIKSFIPINQQEDAEYFSKQFNYQQAKVENRTKKRKRAGTAKIRKKKRRRITRTKK